MSPMTTSVLNSLNQALHQAFSKDPRVYLLGEDVLDPYGGAFKVTQGLSSVYPDRVLTTPVSEAGITGIAAGMALRGLKPVVEIMFGDFVTLIADQLINHIAKFRWMYNDQVRVPLVIRTPMGGGRGYGPTHSQTLEKLFLGVPGLRVLAPSNLVDPGKLLASTILESDDPTLFIENKLLYPLPVLDTTALSEFTCMVNPPARAVGKLTSPFAPTIALAVKGAPPPILTIAAYGYMVELARQAVLRLAYEEEIFTELVVSTQLSPFEIEPLLTSVLRTGRLLVVEEGTLNLGWGAEILARCFEHSGQTLKAAARLGAADHPVPAASSLEQESLPGIEDFLKTARRLCHKGALEYAR